MLKPVFAIISCLCFSVLHAQYYYQDIVSLENTSSNFKKLTSNKIKKVTATSIEPDGSETEGFGITQEVNSRKNELVTISQSDITGTSTLTTFFNEQGKTKNLTDSTNHTVNDIQYTYDAAGRLKQVSSASHEPGDTNRYSITEDHVFFYNTQGYLTNMLKIKNKADTMLVIFKPGKNGLPEQEEWWYKGFKQDTWYYYYDSNGKITDIVRFNKIAQKMIPDYVFEYDEDGDLSQQTVVLPGTNFYRVWVYEYNENGLKKAESILEKGKVQVARIIYDYD